MSPCLLRPPGGRSGREQAPRGPDLAVPAAAAAALPGDHRPPPAGGGTASRAHTPPATRGTSQAAGRQRGPDQAARSPTPVHARIAGGPGRHLARGDAEPTPQRAAAVKAGRCAATRLGLDGRLAAVVDGGSATARGAATFPTRPPRRPDTGRAGRERAPPGTTRPGADRGPRRRDVGAAEIAAYRLRPRAAPPQWGPSTGNGPGCPLGPIPHEGPRGRGPRAAAVAYAPGVRGPQLDSSSGRLRRLGTIERPPGRRAAPIPREAVARAAGGLVRSRRPAARRAGGAGARAAAGRWWSACGCTAAMLAPLRISCGSPPGLRLS